MPRILVVDDEPDLVELLTYNLEKEGHSVLSATDGQEALRSMEGSRPDAVLLDLMMPNMDGFQTLTEIRSRSGFAGIPVIMLTARGAVDDRIKGLELGRMIIWRSRLVRRNWFFDWMQCYVAPNRQE